MKGLYYLAIFLLLWYGIASKETHRAQDISRAPKKSNYRVLQTTGDITLPPNTVSISNLFTLAFEFKPAGYITMAIKFNLPNQYFGIGFGTGMTGADIWVFQIINSEITVSDRVGTGRTSPKLDTTQGGTSDLQRLGYEITSSYSLVKIRRKLNTNDTADAVISEGLTNMIYAYGTTPTIMNHGKSGRGTIVIPLIGGTEGFTTEDESVGEKVLIEGLHSTLNIIAWGAIADIAIILVRLLRSKKIVVLGKIVVPAQVIHASLISFAILISGFATGYMIYTNRKERGSELLEIEDRDFHFINGLIILALTIFTVITGCVTLFSLRTYFRRTNYIVLMKMSHRVAGALVYLQAKANILTGAIFYQEGIWKVGVFIYVSALVAIHIALGIMHWYLARNSNIPALNLHRDIKLADSYRRGLLEVLNRGMPREEVVRLFPDIKWVLIGNGVYDLTGWFHPGGNFIIEACIGREVGRYFYGNYSLEGSRFKPHTHTALTISQLHNFFIGDISNYESIFCLKKGEKNTVSKPTDQWRMTRVTPISETVSEVSFRNANFQVKKFGKSLSWLGRHFRVSFDRNNSLGRQYTTALSLTKGNTQLRESIYLFFNELLDGNKTIPFAFEMNTFSAFNSISLFIKNYRAFDGLSHAIHQTRVTTLANKFRVEGPLGRGLELTTRSTGVHCIICSGTGILPIVDFLNLFLWKTMYKLIKERGGIKRAEMINPYGIPFDNFFNGMSIKFIGAFPSVNDVLGLDIIKKLAEINKKYNTNNFKAMIKGYSDENIMGVNGDFGSIEFLSKYIDKKENKFYIVGPPRFNEDVPKSLEALGISQGRIMLV